MDAVDWHKLRAKLERVIEARPEVPGADRHRWRLEPPLAEKKVAAFERAHGVRLPADYRGFLTNIADGGAGPGSGLYGLKAAYEDTQWSERGRLGSPFPLADTYALRFEEEEEEDSEPPRRSDGVLCLSRREDGQRWMLVVTGVMRGIVMHDREAIGEGWASCERSFLTWYEAWLGEALARVEGLAAELVAARERLTGEVGHDGPMLVAMAEQAVRIGRVEEAGALLREAGAIGQVVTDRQREPIVTHAEGLIGHAGAVQHIERLLAACPGFSLGQQARLRLRLGQGLGGLGRHAESLEVLEELCSGPLAEALGEGARAARVQVAFALTQFERHAEALGYLDEGSSDALETNMIGTIYSALGRHEEALAAFRRSCRCSLDWVVPWDNSGHVYFQMGRIEEAIEVHRAVIADDDSYAWGHYHLALALASHGEHAEASAALERAVELGYDRGQILEDPYAQALRGTEAWRRILEGSPGGDR